MTNLILLAVVGVMLVGTLSFLKERFGGEDGGGGDGEKEKAKYSYTRKQFFMNRPEHEFYDVLVSVIGDQYYVFAQVHLPTVLEHSVKGQNYNAAFRHINGKSVDFVLCDKAYISPKLAIELDGRSHEREDRQLRDVEVERIFKEAGLPLLRLENHGTPNPIELKQKISEILGK